MTNYTYLTDTGCRAMEAVGEVVVVVVAMEAATSARGQLPTAAHAMHACRSDAAPLFGVIQPP